MACDGTGWANESDAHPSGPATDAGDLNDVSGSCKAAESESEAGSLSLHDRLEQHVAKKVGFVIIFCSYSHDIACLRICPLNIMP